jgi:mannose-1-phosphate guanylyltransferase
MPKTPNERFHAVIPAGGVGSRLWPLSRAAAPKFLHDLTGSGRTLLQGTWDRLVPLAGDRIAVVAGAAHESGILEQLTGLLPANLFLEQSPRDSSAAIALAAAILSKREPDVIIGSFAADHAIADEQAFARTIREAIEVAATGRLVTIGIQPTFAATSFGYVHAGAALKVAGAPNARQVKDFVEKPNKALAQEFFESGNFLWNAGMFVAPASLILEQLAQSEPELHDRILEIAAAWDTPQRDDLVSEFWPQLKKIAFDYSVAEPAAAAGLVAVIPAEFEWHDVGDFAGVAELLSGGRPDNLAVIGDAQLLAEDSSGILVGQSNRLIAVVGLKDIIIVDTPDALLITTKEHAQNVKNIVETLKNSGHGDVL